MKLVCKPLQTCSLEGCPLIFLLPPDSVTSRSSRQRWDHTLSLQFFSRAWTPHWLLLTCTALLMRRLGITLFLMSIFTYQTCTLSNITSAPHLYLFSRSYWFCCTKKILRKEASNMAKLGKKTPKHFNTQWVLWQRQHYQMGRFSWAAFHQHNPRCRVPDGRKFTRAKATLGKAWPQASIVQDERNTEQEGDVKRAYSSFSGSVPLLDLIILHSFASWNFFFSF